MPLSWNEIRDRALAFSKEWADESSEHAEAKTFWDDFFNIFGVARRRIASFEQHVKKIDGKNGFIDLLWKGVLLIEHKSRGKNLDRARAQALDYFPGLKDRDLPRYVMVSDFARFRLYDLDSNSEHEFALEDLHKNIKLFGFVAGYTTRTFEEKIPVNIKAAERMGKLHDLMKEVGYAGHPLELYLVRLLFCMFADGTGIFDRQQFQNYIEDRTSEDGADLGSHLVSIFHVLNTPVDKRLRNLDEQLASFPYVNGKLFEEMLQPASFDAQMRQELLDCCALDWGEISPAIFGSLFQSIMDNKAKRNLGAHYTSEINILKLINPLFMEELRAEFEEVKSRKDYLIGFHKKLRSLTFLDPACGCGNFLVIAYRELRLLELEVLREAGKSGWLSGDAHSMIRLDVDQFYGIEIKEFPAQIAQVALWLIDHQMNLRVSEEFGVYFSRIPLKSKAKIVNANALRLDWADVIDPGKLTYIIGNPPFGGAKKIEGGHRKADMALVLRGIKNAGLLDYVAAWYVKTANLMQANNNIECAFVSTNSINSGEQVGVLWGWLLIQQVKIRFAHRSFAWGNEATSYQAAVHCVIVGFGLSEPAVKRLFEYDDVKGTPIEIRARNISPYLVDMDNTLLVGRKKPICDAPEIGIGNKPIDNGNYLFKTEEKEEFIKVEPKAIKWFRRWLGAREFIHGYERWCLWLGDCPPNELKRMPESYKRVVAVKQFRLESPSKPTNRLAETPTRFHVENFPENRYLIIPGVSSERRRFVPIGFGTPETMCSNLVNIIQDASLFHFGVLTSTMHNSWMRAVCGRLESRYRYSIGIVYNNFPWPLSPTEAQKNTIAAKAQVVINARKCFPNATLADLYDPLAMPVKLIKAHQELDKAVDAIYTKVKFKTESERVSFLFKLYKEYTAS